MVIVLIGVRLLLKDGFCALLSVRRLRYSVDVALRLSSRDPDYVNIYAPFLAMLDL